MPPPLSTSTTLKRIHREVSDLKKEDLGTISLSPSDDNLFNWTATIPGPEGSCYEGGLFHVDINLAHDYPFSAPKVTFRTRIYHMNINDRGNICIDILKHNWSPALSLFKVILSLSSLLTDPNPKDPLVPSIATEYLRNRSQHDRTARHWTELYARPRPSATVASSVSTTKGKERAPSATVAVPPSSARRAGSTSAASSTQTQVITISDDSENEVSSATRAPRTRAKRKRGQGGADDEPVVESDGVIDQPTRKRRAATAGRRNAPVAAGSSSRISDDVIVIED